MQKKQMKKYASCIPTIIMMVVIFRFSAANGTESSGTSSGLLEKILEETQIIFRFHLSVQEKFQLLNILETPLRKSAHMIEYMFLVLAVMFALYEFEWRGKTWIVGSAIFSILYACTDEIHQYFVPGRAGRVTDVLVDSVGIWIGIGIATWIVFVLEKRKRETKKAKIPL